MPVKISPAAPEAYVKKYMIRSFYCDPNDTDIVSDETASGFFMEEWFFRCQSARMAGETSGIDKYDKIPLLVNRCLTQFHLVAPGGLSTVAKARRGRPISK